MQSRPAAVANLFYPADPVALRRLVRRYLEQARDRVAPARRCPKVLVVPHAGYVYSGPVAASGYVLLEPWAERIGRVVLLGTAHHAASGGALFAPYAQWECPLGTFPVELDTLEMLQARGLAHPNAAAHRKEHSLEVQLPFLAEVLGTRPLVPLVVARCSLEEAQQVAATVWDEDETLLVVSSDLSHYLPYEVARQVDRRTAEQIVHLAAESLSPEAACGFYALRGVLAEARRRGCEAQLLDLRNSGDTAGPRNEVVGYGAFALYEPS